MEMIISGIIGIRRGNEFFTVGEDVAVKKTPWFYFIQKPFTERRRQRLTPAGVAILDALSVVPEVFSVRFGCESPCTKGMALKTVWVSYADDVDMFNAGVKISRLLSRF